MTTSESSGPASGRARAAQVARRALPVLAGALIALGVVAAPLGVMAAHARQLLVHTDTFVATFAPLAREPEVQDAVVAAVTAAFHETVDLPGLLAGAVEGLEGLPLPGPVTDALGELDAAVLTAQVDETVRKVVESEGFATLWEGSLRAAHAGIGGALGTDGPVSVDRAGVVRLELGAVIAEVRSRLIDSGWYLAWLIPEVDRSVVVAEVAALGPVVRVAERVSAAGTWLPMVAVAALAGGVLLAPRRRTALTVAATGVTVGMGLLAGGLVIGRGQVVAAVAEAGTRLTEPTTRALYDVATAAASGTALGVGTVAAVVAVGAWLAGRGERTRAVFVSRDGGAGGAA